jgi:hypothetical protein
MKTRLTATVLALAAAATALAVSAAAAPQAARAKKTVPVTIAMHDPGCHWFAVGTSFKKSLTVRGIALVRNIDEAGLLFKGPGLSTTLAVGKTLQIAKPGVYHITMVKQASDDNHLVLRVTA